MSSEYFSAHRNLLKYDEQSSGSRRNTQNTIPWFLSPQTRFRVVAGRGGSLPVYFSACVWLRVNRHHEVGGEEAEKKERSELKKWNKHANAGHFPSLSLRAECKCVDLTVCAAQVAREG